MKVLCIRTEPGDVSDEIRARLKEVYGDVELEFANPHTPEQFSEMAHQQGVVATLLQERPLPTKLLEEGDVPVLVQTPMGLMRLVRVQPILEPLA